MYLKQASPPRCGHGRPLTDIYHYLHTSIVHGPVHVCHPTTLPYTLCARVFVCTLNSTQYLLVWATKSVAALSGCECDVGSQLRRTGRTLRCCEPASLRHRQS